MSGAAASTRGGLAAVTVLLLLAVCPGAQADGDPASDYLVTQNVYLSSDAPSGSASSALAQAVAQVYAQGGRVKVALIYSAGDLGSVASLYGQPAAYARFLALELSYWYGGPLLVAMPAGFGVYDDGRSTTADDRVLQSIRPAASTPDALATSATAAVQQLDAAHALDSKDTERPLATAYPAKAARGKTSTLHFDLYDDSGRTRSIVRVYEGSAQIATLGTQLEYAVGTRHAEVRWPVPKQIRSRQLRFCVVAVDPAGNHSTPACAPFLRVT
jgi:hypothetical protein